MTPSPPVRLAMWSGPRNISTAMMRAWENRPDTVVWDEPLYAHYLAETGLEHPGRAEILRAGQVDWRDVAKQATGPVPAGARVFYQKHMSHHLLPGIERGWLAELTHVFLIRDPREVLLSYTRTREAVSLAEIGFSQQWELYQWLERVQGQAPLVIDSADFLRDPETHLRVICRHVGLEFIPEMLRWPPGPRESDGVWAPYWYAAVSASRGFAPWTPRSGQLDSRLAVIEREARPIYDALAAVAWKP